jgi:2-methylcitrate dehydratase PrpD
MGDYLDRIAAFAAETRYGDISERALDAARWILLDTLGGMLASSTLEEPRGFAKLAVERSGARTSTLVGFGEKADAMWAAMVNATSACSYETDEGNRLGGGHPAIHTIPPALAEAQARHTSGRELLTTIIVAYEVMSRLASGSPARWPVHSHGTHGSPGAAVAVARLRGRNAVEMRDIINLSTSMSPATSWQVCFEGGTVRNLYPAESAMLGMLAVDLAGCGFTGALDGPGEMYGKVLGQGSYDPERVVLGLGEEWRVTTNYFKLHASCAITHPALDAMQDILARRPLNPHDIESIDVHAGGIAPHLGYREPANMLSAKFSIPYSIAALVIQGGTGIEAFQGHALSDPGIRDLAARVTVHDDPSAAPPPAHRTARVEVRVSTGEVLTAETRVVRGDAANPVSHTTLMEKFHQLASLRLSSDAVAAVASAVLEIDCIEDVANLHSILSGG